MRTVGIDLGTTHTVCAFADDEDAPALLPIAQVAGGGRTVSSLPLLPSFVYFPHPSEGPLPLPWDEKRTFAVGTYAQERATQAPTRVISSAKSWLAHRSVDRRAPILPQSAPEDVEKISPVEASWRYLEHVVEAYAHTSGRNLADEDIVLTVPASFDAAARELTVEAAFAAGLEGVTLLEEPQAAVYAWIAARGDRFRKELAPGDLLLVVDVGGGTTDFSAITVRDVDGNLALERVAVGEHILLGGDNMDLALAHLARQKLEAEGKDVADVPLAGLAHACRTAKERLLGDDAPSEVAVAIAKPGAKLVGGAVKTTLAKADVERIVAEGFFPDVDRDARPAVRMRGGLTQVGLPYAHDAAITKHLASFLGRHGNLQPTCILFNGGVMRSPLLRRRIEALLGRWLAEAGAPPARVLEGADYDGGVAKGAAAYARARKTNGIRIRGGTARSYYVGIEEAAPAVPGITPRVTPLCIAPFGMEEGMTAEVAEGLGLVVGERVRFRFFGSTVRKDDRAGAVLAASDDLEELAPIDVAVPADGREEGDVVPVRLRATVTAIGTLELEAVPLEPRSETDRFVLELAVREGA